MGNIFTGNEKHRFWLITGFFVVVKLAVHFLTSTNYGLHRDAYLYIAQSEHLAWGFISVPPLTPFLISISSWFFGYSVFAMRILPAVAGAVNIILIGLMVREIGGKTTATMLACAAYLLSPAFLRSNSLLQPVSFDQLFWTCSAFLVVKLVSTRDPWYWIALGLMAGIGMLNKYAVIFFFIGLFFALLVTVERKWFFGRSLYFGVLIGFLITVPNLIWQYNHNWPVIHHMQELRESQLAHVSYPGFLFGQVLMNFNVTFIWLAGVFFFLCAKNGKNYRIIGWTFILTLLILMFLNGKPYYTLGLYLMLFAGGGVVIEQWFIQRFKVIPYVLVFLMVILLIPGLPLSLPVYSHHRMVGYGKWASQYGMKEAFRWEDGTYYSLPQDYADMTGWEEMVSKVAALYHSLPQRDKEKCLIMGGSYGHAGALSYFRHKYHLPEPVSFSESFVLWAPDTIDASMIIVVEESPEKESPYFRSVIVKDSVEDLYSRDRGFIHLFSDPVGSLPVSWRHLAREHKAEFSRKIRKVLEKENDAGNP